MTRYDLIEAVTLKTKLPRSKMDKAVRLIFDSMTEAMLKGERIEIRGLGSFVVKSYGGYQGRNPKTGESIQVRPKRLPFFKVGKELKEFVDGKTPNG